MSPRGLSMIDIRGARWSDWRIEIGGGVVVACQPAAWRWYLKVGVHTREVILAPCEVTDFLDSFFTQYRDCRQDVALEMERNWAAAKQSQVRPSNQLLLSFPPFPVRHPGDDHGTHSWRKLYFCTRLEVRCYLCENCTVLCRVSTYACTEHFAWLFSHA